MIVTKMMMIFARVVIFASMAGSFVVLWSVQPPPDCSLQRWFFGPTYCPGRAWVVGLLYLVASTAVGVLVIAGYARILRGLNKREK